VKLDVVVPTYNRSGLLQKTIRSLLSAAVPAGLQVTIFVVDNNSKDDTATVMQNFAKTSSPSVVYVRETKQGLSHARNAGITAGDGDLIGFIDDDEEVATTWFEVIYREFADPSVDFIGGPYLGNWSMEAPVWLPPGYHAAIGVVSPKPRAKFGPDFSGNLMGGNAVIRRHVFEKIGMYDTRLGRSGEGLLSEEDAEFCQRLEAAAISGMYVPDLFIHHYIPPERLTRKYHRRWAFWRAVSQGVLARTEKEPVPHFAGVPRHRIGRAIRSLAAMPGHRMNKSMAGQAFADELAVRDLVGYAYGKHFINITKFYKDKA
jgi:glycosyltransferase involved in cell wall biosynthesis